jgi:hypothetical protein
MDHLIRAAIATGLTLVPYAALASKIIGNG